MTAAAAPCVSTGHLPPPEDVQALPADAGYRPAAAVYGAMQAVAEFALPLHVVGLVSAAENMPSKPYESHGGTGVGVRLLAQFLTDYAHESLLPSPEPAGVREGD